MMLVLFWRNYTSKLLKGLPTIKKSCPGDPEYCPAKEWVQGRNEHSMN